jgi:adenylate cyclase
MAMTSDMQNDRELISRLMRERDVYKLQVARMQAEYEEKIKELSILKELGETLRFINELDTRAFWENQLSILARSLTFEHVSLMLLNQSHHTLEEVATYGNLLPMESLAGQQDRATREAFSTRQPVVIPEPPSTGPVTEAADGWALACLPVLHNKSCIGILRLHREAKGFEPNLLRFLHLVADGFATGVVLSRIYHQLIHEEKQRLALCRFFPSQVREKILSSQENLRLGGERKQVTILFADLQGFTSMSEEIDHDKVVNILNSYFSLMTPIIFQHNGTLDKLMGDGMLALFGAPMSHGDDPYQAVHTAIEMLKALRRFNRDNQQKGWPELHLTIGINAGEVVAGYIGSEEHMNYTVIGDAVNVAQRIQSIAESDQILISAAVRDLIHQGRLQDIEGFNRLQQLPVRKLKGREQEIEIYELNLDLAVPGHRLE